MQTTDNVFLVRPSNFVFNAETALSNAFQNKMNESGEVIKQKVFKEFEQFAATLQLNGINVLVFDDTSEPQKPDAIFPNNWITMHANGSVVLYPMCAVNRRYERRQDIIDTLKRKFEITNILDLSYYENEGKFLEGTGSIVFDHTNKIAYACLSPRTDKEVFLELCSFLNYQPIYFYSHDKNGKEIYHTNVMMCIGNGFAVICLESITNLEERLSVSFSLTNTRHQIIDISFEQMNQFAGNMLALKTNSNENILVLSQSSFNSLNTVQKISIEKYAKLLALSINTIETIGGGSARCMIAEIFLHSINN
jgi:hypothetical protein